MPPILAIDELTVGLASDGAPIGVVRDVSLEVGRGEFVGLVGESGSGKTMTALSMLRLLPPGVQIEEGEIRLHGENLVARDEKQMRGVRGGKVGMIFQEAMTSLNPALTVGFQLREAIRAHSDCSRSEAGKEAERLLRLVAMPNVRQLLGAYPHQLSGGQRQRAVIAMALAGRPSLLIADEPTSALDVTVQAQILEVLVSLRSELEIAMLLITHDLAIVAETCDRVAVMYAGEIVEEGSVRAVLGRPAHPYTRKLLGTVPRFGSAQTDRAFDVIPGEMPTPGAIPTGCAFHPRCEQEVERCRRDVPQLVELEGGYVRCHLAEPGST